LSRFAHAEMRKSHGRRLTSWTSACLRRRTEKIRSGVQA
jgi:hypothetical protein